MAEGFYLPVSAVFPSVTNVNNASISCGAWPAEHGICANSYFDEERGQAAYMNSGDLIRVETLFQRAARCGVRTGLLSAKRKTLELFNKGVALAATAEDPPTDLVVRHGQPSGIYSREILLVVAGCRGSPEDPAGPRVTICAYDRLSDA